MTGGAPKASAGMQLGRLDVNIKDARAEFARTHADALAEQAGASASSRLRSSALSTRYTWYRDDQTLTLVVGPQEENQSDAALAVGLAERGNRELQLVLPAGWHEPTLHRWAWLREDLPLAVWSHEHGATSPEQRPSVAETKILMTSEEDPALYLGERTAWVEELMRWAGAHRDLDPSHRRDVRAWHCRGQRVLRIKRTRTGLEIVAGIDWGTSSPNKSPVPVSVLGPLTDSQLEAIKEAVGRGCDQRMTAAGVAYKADEHWLQAVLRRHPDKLGLEQPVLRELAAWRPTGGAKSTHGKPRGRGFVDLAGLDSTGVLVLVETKLGADDMLVLQGLDYLIWAEANRSRLTSRLDCRREIPIEIAYVVGGKGGGEPTWSRHAAAQFDAVHPDIRWHVQQVTDWTEDDPHCTRGALHTFPITASASATPPHVHTSL